VGHRLGPVDGGPIVFEPQAPDRVVHRLVRGFADGLGGPKRLLRVVENGVGSTLGEQVRGVRVGLALAVGVGHFAPPFFVAAQKASEIA